MIGQTLEQVIHHTTGVAWHQGIPTIPDSLGYNIQKIKISMIKQTEDIGL